MGQHYRHNGYVDDATLDATIFRARSAVLADLSVRAEADAEAVSILEESCSQRRWWLEQWAAGAEFVAGLVAQDVQDQLRSWPQCTLADDEHDELPPHVLRIDPDLGGPNPHWVCEEAGQVVAPLGRLS